MKFFLLKEVGILLGLPVFVRVWSTLIRFLRWRLLRWCRVGRLLWGRRPVIRLWRNSRRLWMTACQKLG